MVKPKDQKVYPKKGNSNVSQTRKQIDNLIAEDRVFIKNMFTKLKQDEMDNT